MVIGQFMGPEYGKEDDDSQDQDHGPFGAGEKAGIAALMLRNVLEPA